MDTRRHFVHIYSGRENLSLLSVPGWVIKSFVLTAYPSQGHSGKWRPLGPISSDAETTASASPVPAAMQLLASRGQLQEAVQG